mmetsp:Transcript_41865/g.77788  ORF Transcript_41865/g.77788 Transcript_41865/m.77788 type:complete len:237 (+) Transcript_41865:103-813(+)
MQCLKLATEIKPPYMTAAPSATCLCSKLCCLRPEASKAKRLLSECIRLSTSLHIRRQLFVRDLLALAYSESDSPVVPLRRTERPCRRHGPVIGRLLVLVVIVPPAHQMILEHATDRIVDLRLLRNEACHLLMDLDEIEARAGAAADCILYTLSMNLQVAMLLLPDARVGLWRCNAQDKLPLLLWFDALAILSELLPQVSFPTDRLQVLCPGVGRQGTLGLRIRPPARQPVQGAGVL